MGVYLDLKPSPQFDRSLVDYMVYNFREIQTALLHIQGTIDLSFNYGVGPWDVNVIINVPFPCNISLYTECTWYSTIAQMTGIVLKWDGATLPMWLDKYCNEPNSYMKTAATQSILGVTSTGHVLTFSMQPNMGRHANDRIRWAATFYST
jgi:hypothetical protein